jgi:hypothetical protein
VNLTGVLCVLAAVALVGPAAASAEHRGGVTYTGNTIDAGFAGPVSGTVEFDVSLDGSSVTRFAVNFVMPTLPFGPPSCAGTTISQTFTGTVPIGSPPGYPPEYHFFDTSPIDAPETVPLDFDGSVGGVGGPDPGAMSGRFSYEDPDYPNSGCTTGGGIGFEGTATCMQPATQASAQQKIDALKAKVKKLKKKLKAAKRADAPDKVKKLKKKLKKLKQQLAAAEGQLLPQCQAP